MPLQNLGQFLLLISAHRSKTLVRAIAITNKTSKTFISLRNKTLVLVITHLYKYSKW
ncbi:asl1735 [Nostoc sp. PCC 7120 = FACHB-418]|nr:asl1735 [Nostoc sp. PCC 7120 = FACHB-418]